MCGRFFIDASQDLDDLLEAIECERRQQDIEDLFNIAPTDRIPVIIQNQGANRLFKSTWWFHPLGPPILILASTPCLMQKAKRSTQVEPLQNHSDISAALFPLLGLLNGFSPLMASNQWKYGIQTVRYF